ncbi:hypothetical protein BH11VER1_BH11VER1_35560 [soil metagenome]
MEQDVPRMFTALEFARSIQVLTVEVLAVTIFLSLLLAVFFVVLFLGSQRRTRHSMEQDALLPLDEGRAPSNSIPPVPAAARSQSQLLP